MSIYKNTNACQHKCTPAELARRAKVFYLFKFINPATGKRFAKVEISRVLMKHWQEYLNPALDQDKLTMIHYLRDQYYKDIKLDAEARRVQAQPFILV